MLATKEELETQVKALETAIKGLKESAPAEVDYSCTQGVFKAKVIDENGDPMENIVINIYEEV